AKAAEVANKLGKRDQQAVATATDPGAEAEKRLAAKQGKEPTGRQDARAVENVSRDTFSRLHREPKEGWACDLGASGTLIRGLRASVVPHLMREEFKRVAELRGGPVGVVEDSGYLLAHGIGGPVPEKALTWPLLDLVGAILGEVAAVERHSATGADDPFAEPG